jgi:hypothetical protein
VKRTVIFRNCIASAIGISAGIWLSIIFYNHERHERFMYPLVLISLVVPALIRWIAGNHKILLSFIPFAGLLAGLIFWRQEAWTTTRILESVGEGSIFLFPALLYAYFATLDEIDTSKSR